ncbi:MAG: cyclic nucleotide-binding domain-containing protein [Polyangiaceae bacterium]
MQAEPELASVEARARLLGSMPDLRSVSVDTLLLMAERSRYRRFRPRAVIWRATDPITSVLYVLEGSVRVEHEGTLVGRVESQRALGFTALLTERDHLSATTEARTLALEIPGDAVRIALQRDFALQRFVLRGLARDLLAERGPLPNRSDPPEHGTFRDEELTVVERVIQLRRSPIARANVEGLAEIASASTDVRFQRGDVLWSAGDVANHWIRVTAGLVECETARGERATVGAGTDMGFLDALAEVPRAHTARAASAVSALRIELIDWFTVLELHTRVATELTAHLARGLRGD